MLNVRAGGEPLGRWLTEAAEAGEPYRVTLHQLTAMPVLPWAIDLYVCQSKRARTLTHMLANPRTAFAVDDRRADVWLQGMGAALLWENLRHG